MNIVNLNEGECATIVDIEDSPVKNRLVAMGFLKGKKICILRKSKFSTNIMIEINGTVYGLRPEEARSVQLSASA